MRKAMPRGPPSQPRSSRPNPVSAETWNSPSSVARSHIRQAALSTLPPRYSASTEYRETPVLSNVRND